MTEAKAGLVLLVHNNHVESCGEPPNLVSLDYSYCSMFQNCHGEQIVFYREKESGHTFVQMGDCGWARKLRVIAGGVPGITMNPEELKFVHASWLATTYHAPHKDGDLHDEYLSLMEPTRKNFDKKNFDARMEAYEKFLIKIGNRFADEEENDDVEA